MILDRIKRVGHKLFMRIDPEKRFDQFSSATEIFTFIFKNDNHFAIITADKYFVDACIVSALMSRCIVEVNQRFVVKKPHILVISSVAVDLFIRDDCQ